MPFQLYLDAWTYASNHLPTPLPFSLEPGSSRALLSLIPNWSSPEFQKFVDDIGDLVNDIDTSRDSDLTKRHYGMKNDSGRLVKSEFSGFN